MGHRHNLSRSLRFLPQIGAPRCWACSSDSRIRVAAPSAGHQPIAVDVKWAWGFVRVLVLFRGSIDDVNTAALATCISSRPANRLLSVPFRTPCKVRNLIDKWTPSSMAMVS